MKVNYFLFNPHQLMSLVFSPFDATNTSRVFQFFETVVDAD